MYRLIRLAIVKEKPWNIALRMLRDQRIVWLGIFYKVAIDVFFLLYNEVPIIVHTSVIFKFAKNTVDKVV